MMAIIFVLYMIIISLTIFTSCTFVLVLLKNRKTLFVDPEPRENPLVSICIPVWNKKDTVVDVIKNVLSLKYKNLEVIVVNDASTDGSLGKIKQFIKEKKPKNLKLINRKKNSGGFKGVPLNEGFKVAKGEIFGFIDADTFIEKEALKNILGYFNNSGVGAVIPAIKVDKPKKWLERLQRIEYILTMLSRKVLTFLNSLFIAPGCAFFRKSVLEEIGGFDEKNKCEDLEIGLRVQKFGYDIQNTVNSFVYTVVPRKLKVLLRQRIRWNRGMIHNVRKYRDMFFEKSNLGVFVLPFVFIGTVFTVFLYGFLLAFSIYDAAHNFWIFMNGYILSGYDLYLLQLDFMFEPNIVILFSIFLMIFFSVNVYFSNKIGEKRLGSLVFEVILFLIIYAPLLSIGWVITMIEELTNKEEEW